MLFFKCLLLLCSNYFWHCSLSGCLKLCLTCFWCYFFKCIKLLCSNYFWPFQLQLCLHLFCTWNQKEQLYLCWTCFCLQFTAIKNESLCSVCTIVHCFEVKCLCIMCNVSHALIDRSMIYVNNSWMRWLNLNDNALSELSHQLFFVASVFVFSSFACLMSLGLICFNPYVSIMMCQCIWQTQMWTMGAKHVQTNHIFLCFTWLCIILHVHLLFGLQRRFLPLTLQKFFSEPLGKKVIFAILQKLVKQTP